LLDPFVRVSARALGFALPIDRIARLRLPTGRALPQPSQRKFEELLTRAFDRSEVLGIAALTPLLATMNAQRGLLGLEAASFIGRSSSIGRGAFKMAERESTITRTAERVVLPFLACVEALALVAAGAALPEDRPASLGVASHRLKVLRLDDLFVDRDFAIIRNATAHHKVRFDEATQTMHLDQRDGSTISMPADRFARAVMTQPSQVMLYAFVSVNFCLDRFLNGTQSSGRDASSLIREALRVTAQGGISAVREWYGSGLESYGKRLRQAAADDLGPATRFAALWR
jgi:hypothetical protein